MSHKKIEVKPIRTAENRALALQVFEKVYRKEKGWVRDPEKLMPLQDLADPKMTWFGAFVGKRLVGVARVLYEIPTALYDTYDFKLTIPDLDVEAFLATNHIAEVGRFAVLPRYRRNFRIAAGLMRALGKDTLDRGFTHLITDVFEADPNTPWGFHRRILGFRQVATHDVGELHCQSKRITMILDLREAERKLMGRSGWFFRFLNAENQPAIPHAPESRMKRQDLAMTI